MNGTGLRDYFIIADSTMFTTRTSIRICDWGGRRTNQKFNMAQHCNNIIAMIHIHNMIYLKVRCGTFNTTTLHRAAISAYN